MLIGEVPEKRRTPLAIRRRRLRVQIERLNAAEQGTPMQEEPVLRTALVFAGDDGRARTAVEARLGPLDGVVLASLDDHQEGAVRRELLQMDLTMILVSRDYDPSRLTTARVPRELGGLSFLCLSPLASLHSRRGDLLSVADSVLNLPDELPETMAAVTAAVLEPLLVHGLVCYRFSDLQSLAGKLGEFRVTSVQRDPRCLVPELEEVLVSLRPTAVQFVIRAGADLRLSHVNLLTRVAQEILPPDCEILFQALVEPGLRGYEVAILANACEQAADRPR